MVSLTRSKCQNLTYIFVNINITVLLWLSMKRNSVSAVLLCLNCFFNPNIMTMTISDHPSVKKNAICQDDFSYNCWIRLSWNKYFWFTEDPGALYNKQDAHDFCVKLGAHLAEFEDSNFIDLARTLHQKHSQFQFWSGKLVTTIHTPFVLSLKIHRHNSNRSKWQW